MSHDATIWQYLIRFRSEEVGWEVSEHVVRRISKRIQMGVPRQTREYKCGEGYRQKIQERSEENTGDEKNGYFRSSRDRGRYESEMVIK